MKRDKAAHAFKLYTYIMQEIWKFLTILIIGALFGYILSLKGPEGNHFIVISIIVALFIGLIIFFIGLFKIIKRDEAERMKKEEQNVSDKAPIQETNEWRI